MSKVWKPRVYQQAMIDFALRHLAEFGKIRINLFSGMGTGKTSTVLEIICTLFVLGEVKRVLIVGPKRVASFTWPEEVMSWTSFSHLRYAVAVGGKDARLAAIHGNAPVVMVNVDVLPTFIHECGDKFPFDMVVWDEATRLGSLRAAAMTSKAGKKFVRLAGGKQARALGKVANTTVRHWINLTGSPGGKGLEGLYGMCWPLDFGRRLGRSYSAFEQRFFRSFIDGEGQRKTEPLQNAQENIQALIRDISLVIESKDYFDLPPLVESVVSVELPPAAMALYKKFEKEMFMEIAGNEVEAFNAASLTNKCRQLANGACIYDENGKWEHIHDAKIEALRSCVEETAGVPLLISYQFKADIARIQKAFPDAVLLDDDPETLRRFNRGEINKLLVHPKSAGHGISMHWSCWNLVDFSTGWNFEEDEQLIERIGTTRQAQSGLNRTVYRRRLIARGTIEEAVLRRVHTKMKVQDILKEALKERGDL